MKIGILTQWYDPEPGPAALPGVLARELVRRGHEVTVLTGFPNYPTGKIVDGYKISRKLRENLDGVDITRTFLLPQLPQLWDVLRGEMSLVGPRPEVPEYVEQWPDELRPLILSVRPGITDPASIQYRNESDELEMAGDPTRHYVDVILPRKAKMYAEYVEKRSMSGDIRIILQTIRSVVAA